MSKRPKNSDVLLSNTASRKQAEEILDAWTESMTPREIYDILWKRMKNKDSRVWLMELMMILLWVILLYKDATKRLAASRTMVLMMEDRNWTKIERKHIGRN